jgi:hypothetical protein
MAARIESDALLERVTHWRWSSGVWAGIGLLALLAVLYCAAHAARGTLALLVTESEPLQLAPEVRGNLVFLLVSAYTFGAMLTGLGAGARDLGDLRPVLRAGSAVYEELSRRLVPRRIETLLAALAGGAIGFAIELLAGDAPLESISTVLMFFLFALLGVQALITVRQSNVFSDVGAHNVRLNLIDLTPLTPFARNGARNAGYWLLGSAMASLLFASSATPWIGGALVERAVNAALE